MWLKFPTKLNSYGLRYKRENSVFQNMVWIFKNSKCWENSLGIHLTFNYGQDHSSLMLPNFILLKNVSFSGETTYLVIKHPPSQLVKSVNRIRWEQNTKCPVWRAEENASHHWMCTCVIWGSCENWDRIQQVSGGACDSTVLLTSSQVMPLLLVHRPHLSSQNRSRSPVTTQHM